MVKVSDSRKAPKKQIVKSKIENIKVKREPDKRGVVLLSHIPHGFYEEQMFKFFSQFGEVTRLKLIRSKKTGKSKQFAFIEFQFEEVAKIAADTMDNYLMFQKILKCKLIPLEEVKPLTFKNWQTRFRVEKTRRKSIKLHNAVSTDPEKIAKKQREMKSKRHALQKKLTDLGIDYDVINIKVNESFIAPERPRATPVDVAKATRNIFERKNASLEEVVYEGSTQKKESVEKLTDIEIAESGKEDKETKDEDNADFAVMVTDLDDPEITFLSPPQEARIRRKSIKFSQSKTKADKSSSIETESVRSDETRNVSKTPRRSLRKKKREPDSADLVSLEEQNEEGDCNERKKVTSTPAKLRGKKRTSPKTEKRKKAVQKKRKMNETL